MSKNDISKRSKDGTIFLLQSIDNQKNNRGYHIPMIDLGKCKKVTAVLKLFYFGAAWSYHV